jgi:hypothetical protein
MRRDCPRSPRSVQSVDGRDESWIRGGPTSVSGTDLAYGENKIGSGEDSCTQILIGGPPFLNFGGSSLFQNSLADAPFTGFTGTGKRSPHAGPL